MILVSSTGCTSPLYIWVVNCRLGHQLWHTRDVKPFFTAATLYHRTQFWHPACTVKCDGIYHPALHPLPSCLADGKLLDGAILKTLSQVATHFTLFEEVVTCINMDTINKI